MRERNSFPMDVWLSAEKAAKYAPHQLVLQTQTAIARAIMDERGRATTIARKWKRGTRTAEAAVEEVAYEIAEAIEGGDLP